MCNAVQAANPNRGVMTNFLGAIAEQIKAKKALQAGQAPKPIPVRLPPTGGLLGTPMS